MNTEETKLILGLMKTAYPAFYKGISSPEAQGAVNLWSMMFKDDDKNIVLEAVKALMCVLKYPPTIADVKGKIRDITQPAGMTEMEAWNLVLGAIGNANYYADECFNNLPATIRRIIGSPNQLREWAAMESETVNSVIQSNFMRSYTSRSKQEESRDMLPESTKAMIEGLSNTLSLNENNTKEA